MVFSSAIFLYGFLPLFLVAYYATPKRERSLTLSLGSLVFYGWWRPDFVVLMLISTVVDYRAGIGISAARAAGRPTRSWLAASMIVNLGFLSYFKYANFGVDTANAMLASAGYGQIEWTAVVLPIGISFYTFQTMSYTIDIYRGTARPQGRFIDFMSYVVMFPQLVAGPIVRYNTIEDQLRERTHSWSRFARGVLVFQCGLAKKILIADNLAPLADQAFDAGSLTAGSAWLGALAYTFQIYFDFSGYSDMAVGLGLMIGFRLPVNFRAPYRSDSITDFWRRWHISLSSWLRDYLYVPLGGNRRGVRRMYVNLVMVMLLGGLWHGANWTFLAWGGYHGAWLVFERWSGKRPLYHRVPAGLRVALTFLIVLLGWVFFRSADLPSALRYFGFLTGTAAGEPVLLTELGALATIALGAAAIIVVAAPTTERLMVRGSRLWAVAVQPCFLLALLHLHYQEHVPFLYFQF